VEAPEGGSLGSAGEGVLGRKREWRGGGGGVEDGKGVDGVYDALGG